MTDFVRFIRVPRSQAPQDTHLPGFEPVDVARDASPLEKFEAFHAANPWVYAEMVAFARILVAAQARRGRKPRIAVKALIERLRWDWELRTVSDDEFKINNNHAPYYARTIMRNEPDLADVFETREIRSS